MSTERSLVRVGKRARNGERRFTEGGGVNGVIAEWSGLVPVALGNGSERRVPFDPEGEPLTFDLSYAFARITTAYTAATSFRLEKSAGGNSVFTPVTVTTLSIAAGDYEDESTAFSSSIDSGDILRLVFTAVGANCGFDVQLLGPVA